MAAMIIATIAPIEVNFFGGQKTEEENAAEKAAQLSILKGKVADLESKLASMGVQHSPLLNESWGCGTYHAQSNEIDVILSQDDFFELVEDYTIKVKSRRKIDKEETDFTSAILAAEKVVGRVEALLHSMPSPDHFNNKCEVHVPGLGLLSINRILLLEDACSDVLQEYLSSGWRIIAACPQPDSRRPDYILGRYEIDVNEDRAARP